MLTWKVYCSSIFYEKNYLRRYLESKEESKEESNIQETVATEMTFMGRKPEQNKKNKHSIKQRDLEDSPGNTFK